MKNNNNLFYKILSNHNIMKSIFKKLNIDDKIIKHTKKHKKVRFENVKDIIPSAEDYNFQMDYLELPKTKQGFNRLLVMVDLATDELDFEPTKNKDAKTTLNAMKAIFKRPYLNKPYASIRTDSGKEFKGDVAKYLYNESILHSVGAVGRHRQTANVESANRQIATFLNAYMNSIELNTGRTYSEWTDILPKLRKELNSYRKITIPKNALYQPLINITKELPVFNIGDLVYRKLDVPKDARGYDQPTRNFRAGDITLDFIPRKILRVLYYPKNIRYTIEGIPGTSYTKEELTLAEEEEEKFEVKEIINHKKIKGKMHYRVWFYNEPKKNAIWLPETQLIEDGLSDYIDFYKNKYKTKK